jgi:RNA polymerase sigma factor (sigma-70 family)
VAAAAKRGELTGGASLRLLAGASDERLVALARAGDEQAFAAIVERYRAPLLRYCLGYLPAAAAEDALQQTFINAYAALSRADARAPETLRPWLYRVAHNAALNVARDPQAGLEELPEGLDGVRRPDEVVAARERFRRVIGAVSALPPKQRQVIVRHAVDGDSHERIATDLGMSAGSIRQLAHRARRTVREAAAALLPTPLLRLLPFGADAVEAVPAAGGGAVLAKVAVAVVVAGAAGGGAVEVSKRDRAKTAVAETRVHAAPIRTPVATPPPSRPATVAAPGSGERSSRQGSSRSRHSSSRHGSSGGGSSGSGSSGSSGSGSSDSSGSGSGSSGSSGSGSSGSDSSGSGSSGSGSSDGGSSGSGSSGSDSSGSGSSGSGSSGSGSSGSDSSGSGSSGSGSSGSSGSGSSGSGSSGSDSGLSGSVSGPSGSGSSGTSGSGSSGSSGSGSSGDASTSDSSGKGSVDSSGSDH